MVGLAMRIITEEYHELPRSDGLGGSNEPKITEGCEISGSNELMRFKGHVFDIDLIPFGHGSFDVIIGARSFRDEETVRESETIVSAIRLMKGQQQEIVMVRDFPECIPPNDLLGLPLSYSGKLRFELSLIPGERRPYLDKFMIVFMDDILIYSKTQEGNDRNTYRSAVSWGHVINGNGIRVDLRAYGIILEKEFKKLKRSRIAIIKVRWNSKRGPEFTWEHEDQMKLNDFDTKEEHDHLPWMHSGHMSRREQVVLTPVRGDSLKILMDLMSLYQLGINSGSSSVLWPPERCMSMSIENHFNSQGLVNPLAPRKSYWFFPQPLQGHNFCGLRPRLFTLRYGEFANQYKTYLQVVQHRNGFEKSLQGAVLL
ncbi:hypothetical protein Tco_0953677 [Tanacetum coccineum]|uniref:Uncharacterized protein n=1 Tax=Tanacetum coccineum TaxID=301880 RepID=A0ABQ5E196_9ASTR